MEAYETVKLARDKKRPTAKAYTKELLTNIVELHGDRAFGDDKAVVGGIGELNGMPLTFIAVEKGGDLKERAYRSFGSPRPEGYRKALRLMKQAEKFKRPVLCIVDTAGAYCGEDAEERGQGQAIAQNLYEMMDLKVPTISIIIGEGGSGGALDLSVSSKVYVLENAVYSVISPEACAGILFRDAKKADEAAESLCMTSEYMMKFHVADGIFKEDFNDFKGMCSEIRETLYNDFVQMKKESPEEIMERRYEKFRNIGIYAEKKTSSEKGDID